jgi:hypothetical protein
VWPKTAVAGFHRALPKAIFAQVVAARRVFAQSVSAQQERASSAPG